MASPGYAFVELKSFGDLVMSAAALRLVPAAELARCRLLIGPYLSELCSALAPPCTVEVLCISDRTVPALFDMKKRGVLAGLRSAFTLRTALAGAVPAETLVMEGQAWRERFISGRRRHLAVPKAANVYLAFEGLIFQIFGATAQARPMAHSTRQRRVALCPLSRVRLKNIPPLLVTELAEVCIDAGFEVELLQLEGEHHTPSKALPARTIPRRVDALTAALATYAAVIAADSLPAHLAEYCDTPAFVAKRDVNQYWLPANAFKGKHWGLIGNVPDTTARLRRFLELA